MAIRDARKRSLDRVKTALAATTSVRWGAGGWGFRVTSNLSYQPTAEKLRHICTGRLITKRHRPIYPNFPYYYTSVGFVSVFLPDSCAILTRRRAAPRVVHRVGIPPPPRQSVRLASQATSMCSGTRCFPFSGCHAKKNAVHAKQGNQTVGPIAAIAVEGGARTLVRRFQGARSRDSYDCETGHCKKINKILRMHVMVAEMAERSDVQTEGAPLVHEWAWMVHGCTIHVHSCTVVNHGGGAASVRILQWCSAAASKRGVSCGVPCSPCQIHQEVQMGVCFAVR